MELLQKTIARESRATTIDCIISTISERAKRGKLPISIIQYGSTLYHDKNLSNDLDIFIVADKATMEQFGTLIGQRVGLQYTSITTPQRDLVDLISEKITILKYKTIQGGIPIELNITTTENLLRVFSGNQPAIVRRRGGENERNKYLTPYPSVTLDGRIENVLLAPLQHDDQYFDIAYPGFIPSTSNPNVLIRPKLYDQFLTGKFLHDQAQPPLGQIIQEQVWDKTVRAILTTHHLWTSEGLPSSEAYDDKWIRYILIRSDRFSEAFLEELRERYFQTLSSFQPIRRDSA